jgi:hypothetical protein
MMDLELRDLRSGPLRRLPLGVVLLAMVAAASLPLGVATALGAFDGGGNPDAEDPYAVGQGPHEGGYNTDRRLIESGESSLGAYRMYITAGPEGTCVEVELPDRNPPGGGRAFYADCEGESDSPLNVATVAGEDGAVIYGLAPEGTSRVEIDRGRGPDQAATLRAGEPGGGKKAFIQSSADADVAGTIRAVDREGRELEAEAIP